MTHDQLISLAHVLGYDSAITRKGLCRGYTGMWIQAVCCGDLEAFEQRYSVLKAYANNPEELKADVDSARAQVLKGTLSVSSDPKQKILLEIPAFFEGVSVYLNPPVASSFFSKRFRQDQAVEISAYMESSALAERGGLSCAFKQTDEYKGKKLSEYLLKISQVLQQHPDVAIALNLGNHSVGIRVLGQDQFQLIDTNHLDDVSKRYSSAQLARTLESNYGPSSMFDAKPLVLGTEIYTPKERPLDLHALIPTDRWVPTERVVPTQAFEIDIADNAAMRNEVMTLQHIDFNQIDVNKQMWGLNGSTTLLGTACKYGNQEVFEYLLTRPGIDINRPSLGGYPPFFLCAKSLDLAKKLIERPDFDIHSVADNGDTLFHALATFDPDKAVEFAKILKDKGLDVNQKNKWGEHPLLAACAQGNQTLVEFYLDNGVSLSDLTDRDFSPLMSAVVGGNEQLVQKFLDLGLDPTYQSNNHENLLHIAGKYGHQSPLIKLLALPGLDCNQPNSAGKTPLMAACDARHPELIPLLLPKTNLSKNDIKENSSLCLHITQCEKPVQINFLKKALQCYIDDRRLGANYFNSWGFGFSKQQKIDAAQALLNKINGQDIDLQPHLRALRDGRLSFFNRLYQGIPAAEHRLFKDALAQPRAEKDTPEDRPRPSA